MSKCRDLDPLFAPYADGEAQPNDRASVEAHLERCSPCRDRVEEQRTIHSVLTARGSSLRASASDGLRARCAAHAASARADQMKSEQRPVMRRRLSRWVPLSLAASLLLAIAGAFIIGLNDNVEAIAAQLTLDHVKCFQFAPERLKHVDATTAARDWAAKQGWAIDIPASSSSAGLELLGVRRCAMSNGRVAHVMYKWQGRPLSMFVVPRTIHDIPEQQEFVETFGHEAVIWTGRDRTYVLLARARPSELAPVVGYVRTMLGSRDK